ncbi:MAG: hypothetical protein MR938_02525 [Tenericutes bacterium]|nr:hypothetical protein [Mycoplasmatota bacterium]
MNNNQNNINPMNNQNQTYQNNMPQPNQNMNQNTQINTKEQVPNDIRQINQTVTQGQAVPNQIPVQSQGQTQPAQNNIEMVELGNGKSKSEDFSDKTIKFIEGVVNTKDYTNTFTKEEVVPFRILATMCYVPFLFLLPLLTGKYKKSRFLYFHINQGLNLTLAWAIVFFVNKVFRSLFTTTYRYSSTTPGWVDFISYVLYCIVIAITVVGMINTFNGKSKNTSIVGGFRFLK